MESKRESLFLTVRNDIQMLSKDGKYISSMVRSYGQEVWNVLNSMDDALLSSIRLWRYYDDDKMTPTTGHEHECLGAFDVYVEGNSNSEIVEKMMLLFKWDAGKGRYGVHFKTEKGYLIHLKVRRYI